METRHKLDPIIKMAKDDNNEAVLKVNKLYIDKCLYTRTI